MHTITTFPQKRWRLKTFNGGAGLQSTQEAASLCHEPLDSAGVDCVGPVASFLEM